MERSPDEQAQDPTLKWRPTEETLHQPPRARADDEPPTGQVSSQRDDAHYQTGDAIGRGGMGEVISVFDRDLRRNVVMKKLHPDASANRENLRRFVGEARVTGQLSHPNIVPVHDYGVTAEGEPFFTMKHVQGEDLGQLIGRLKRGHPDARRKYRVARRLELFGAVCNALAFAHDRGVIHRDLKPANIMVGAFGEVLVMDWGLAKVLDTIGAQRTPVAMALADSQDLDSSAASLHDPLADPLMTNDGAILGTPAYMPPEQASGELDRVDRRSDVYSLGAVLYELLALRPPYEGGTVWDILSRVADGKRDAPGSRPGDPPVDRELVAIVDKAMALDPDQRYQTVEALHEDLQAYSDHRTIGAASYTRWQRIGLWLRRHRGAVAAAALALCAAIGGVALTSELRRISDAEARRVRRDAARAQLDRARGSGEQDSYARLVAVLEHARRLREVDAAPRSRAEHAEAARALARRLGDDGSSELALLLLDEARRSGLPAKAVAIERWMISSAAERRGQHDALQIRAALDALVDGMIPQEVALRRIVSLGRSSASTRELVRGLFRGRADEATVCTRALTLQRDRATRTPITGRVFHLTRKAPDSTFERDLDEPRLRGLGPALQRAVDRAGRADDTSDDAARHLYVAEALALLLHTRKLQVHLRSAPRDVGLIAAALEGIGELGDPRAAPLLVLWQWRQGPDSLGWTMADRVLRQLSAHAAIDPMAPPLSGITPQLQRALGLLSLGRPDDALATIEDAQRAGPRGLDAVVWHHLRARALLAQERASDASDAAGRALALARRLSADEVAQLERIAKGVAHRPGLTAGAARERARRVAAAAQTWIAALQRLRAQALLAAGDGAGTQALAEAAAHDPHAAELLASIALREGREDLARQHAERAHAADPRAQRARLLLCRLSSRARRHRQLVDHARAALVMDPASLSARLFIADGLRGLSQLDEARGQCTEVLRRDERHLGALRLRGLIQLDMYHRLGQAATAAVADLRRVVTQLPDDTVAQLALVRALVYDQRPHEARLLAERLSQRPAIAASAAALRAWTLWRLGQHREAFAASHAVVEQTGAQDPPPEGLVYAYLVRGSLRGSSGQHEGMRTDLARARALADRLLRPRVDLELARREAYVGQVTPAIDAVRRAIAEGGARWRHLPESRAHLQRWLAQRAVAHERAGRIPQAINDYEAALREGTPNDQHQRAAYQQRLDALRKR